MTDRRGHLRVSVDGVTSEPFRRDPADLGPADGRQPEVRPLSPSADDRVTTSQS